MIVFLYFSLIFPFTSYSFFDTISSERNRCLIMHFIFHVDVDSAFLSWTAVHRLALAGNDSNSIKEEEPLDIRTIPAAIGGDVEKRHGIILAKSTPAKKYGIVTGEPIIKALQKCPNLYLVPPDHALYSEQSKKLMNLLSQYSPVLEKYSIDESFLDMTGIVHTKEDAVILANEIKDHIEKELKFTVSIGISSNKLLAKMGSDLQKPNHVTTLFKEEIPKKCGLFHAATCFLWEKLQKPS